MDTIYEIGTSFERMINPRAFWELYDEMQEEREPADKQTDGDDR
jgi:hypothetical protein